MAQLPSDGRGSISPRATCSEADRHDIGMRRRFISLDYDFHTPQPGRRNAGFREGMVSGASRAPAQVGLTLEPGTPSSQHRLSCSTPASGSTLSFFRDSLSVGISRISGAASVSSDSMMSIFSGCSTPSRKTANTYGEQSWPRDRESIDSASKISESVPEGRLGQEANISTEEDKCVPQILPPLIQFDGLKLPFCEEYDGVNRRKTKTISESIIALIQEQQQDWTPDTPELEESDGIDIVYRSSQYFDRLREIHEIIESKTDPVLGDTPTTPVSVMSLPPPTCKPAVTTPTSPSQLEPKFFKEALDHATVGLDVSPRASLFPDQSSECESENLEVGSVDLKIKYISEKETLQVTIIKAEDIIDPNENEQKINPFIKLSVYQRNKRKKRTRVVWKSRNPVFQEIFHMHDIVEKWLHVTSLLVELFHKKRIGSRCLGAALIWLDDLDLAERNEEQITEIFKTYLH